VQNSNATITVNWAIPSVLNVPSGSFFNYTLTFDKKTSGTWTYTTPTESDASTLTKDFDMATLKSDLGYAVSDSGADIKAKLIAINIYGSSIASDYNALTAIIQGSPPAYTGTITGTVTPTTASIAWSEIITPSLYGYNAVTGWVVGYKLSSEPTTWTKYPIISSAST
jgi:hypothetical protein